MSKKVLIDKQALIDKLMKIPGIGSNSDALKTIKRFPSYEPQKVKVPAYVAEWIEEYKKDDRTLYQVMNDIECAVYYHKGKDLAYKWLFSDEEAGEHQKIFATAYANGYEVEEEPKWVVKKREDSYFKSFTGIDFRSSSAAYEDYAYSFTDKSKAEAVATLIGGTVEQVEV